MLPPVAKIVTEIFMILLAALSAPADAKEFRIDLLQHQTGKVETLVVKRTDAGFALFEEKGDKLVDAGTITAVKGKSYVYVVKFGKRPEQTIDMPAGITGFSIDAIRQAPRLKLAAGEDTIQLERSGNTGYLTPSEGGLTYVIH